MLAHVDPAGVSPQLQGAALFLPAAFCEGPRVLPQVGLMVFHVPAPRRSVRALPSYPSSIAAATEATTLRR